jgi:16S rRNA processing protein RimM
MIRLLNKNCLLKIGILSKPHGVFGEVLIRLLPDFYGSVIKPEWLFIDVNGGIVPFEVLSIKTRGNEAIIVKLDTIDSEKSVNGYQKFDIYINPDALIKSDKKGDTGAGNGIYEFIGFTVFDKKRGNIGIV